MKVKRPLSSNPFKIQSKKSLQLRLNSALNNNKYEQPKRLHTISTYNRPRTTLLQINKKNLFCCHVLAKTCVFSSGWTSLSVME